MSRAIRLSVFGLFLTACAMPVLAQDSNPPSLEQIIEGIGRYQASLFETGNLRLKYSLEKTRNVTSSAHSGDYLRCEWTLINAGDKWFAERRWLDPKRMKDVMIVAEPIVEVIKGKTLLEWDQQNQSAVIDQFDQGRNIFQVLTYTNNLSLDVPAQIVNSVGANISSIREGKPNGPGLRYLPGYLKANMAKYHVIPKQENLNGVACWTVEWDGMDKFWVSPERGFAVMRRISHWGLNEPLQVEVENQDFREVRPGYWLPYTQVEHIYAKVAAEKKEIWDKVTCINTYKLLEASFTEVPVSQFEVKLPPGTRVVDMARQFIYSVDTDQESDPFTAEIAQAKRQFDPSVGQSSLLSRTTLLFILNALIAVAILAVIYYKHRSRTSQ